MKKLDKETTNKVVDTLALIGKGLAVGTAKFLMNGVNDAKRAKQRGVNRLIENRR